MIKVLELFAGIGACSKALENLNIEHEIVDAVEIDKYAIKAFNAIHNTNFEPQDISKWDKDIECDLIMHGSPCQDFSIAGKQAGGDKGAGTRSSLMYETLRIVEKLKPDYVIWENVKNILSKKHVHNFDEYIRQMALLGYGSTWKVLNAKDYGIPQNRERVYTISTRRKVLTLGDWPKGVELKKKLGDILDKEVDEKYYLTQDKINQIQFKDISNTVRTSGHGSLDRHSWDVIRVGGLYDNDKGTHQAGSVYSDKGIAATLDTMSGGNRQPIVIKTANKQGYDLAQDGDGIDLSYPNSNTRRGRVGHGVSKTLACNNLQGVLDGTRIRKLTPKECWRLMGFSDSDFDKAKATGISDTQLYKQAGNSIVVNVLEAIFNVIL